MNGNRIQAYREQFGVTQAELAAEVDVTRQTIAAWERGDRSPSLVQLTRISRGLGVPVDLLIGPDEAQDEPALLFRADKPEVLSADARSFLSRRAHDYAVVERLLGEIPSLPESRPIEGYDFYSVERIASEIRDWLGVEDAPLGDVLALLEVKGLKIIEHRLPGAISGFSAYTQAWGGVIFVNAGHPPERQYFTALHELAHLVFHRLEYDRPFERPGRGDPREKAANHFAAAVLLPRAAIEQELHGYQKRWLPEPFLVDIKKRYGVSVRTVLLRAQDLKLITRTQCGKQLGILNKQYGAEDEPGELREPNTLTRLERLVFTALVQERITTSRAAEVLRRPLMEIRTELGKWMDGAVA